MRPEDRFFVRTHRFIAMGIAMILVFTTLTVRLWDLQVVNGDHYRSLSEQNRVLRLPVDAERGNITDRSGYVLARNIPGFAITVLPIDLPKGKQSDLASKLGAILGRDPAEIGTIIDQQRVRNPYEPVKVSAKQIGRDIALVISERPELFPGVRVEAESLRSYADATLYSPIIGYVGAITEDELTDSQGYLPTSIIGRTGLEWEYEQYLRGTYGWREIERDAAQREIKTLAYQPPVTGNTVVLTVDDRLQKLLDGELRKGVESNQFTQAVGIAMNPQNGEILAMVSIPGYDNNWFVDGITPEQMKILNSDDRHPLVNKAVGDIYPPGSTFKMVTALSALTAGTATRNTVVNVSSTVMTVSGTQFFDWRAHGPLNLVDGYAHSSDIYFYTLAGGGPMGPGITPVGPDNIYKYGSMLGFGQKTGIDLPGEASGIMPSPAWKLQTFDEPWSIGNTYHEAIGQGYVAVTPMQLLNAYAAVANGGTLYTPHLLKEVRDVNGNVVYTQGPKVTRKLDMKPEDLALIREGARKVVTSGHAPMPNAKLPIAGKTGTAEFGESSGKDSAGRNKLGFHNWFVSFLPQQDLPSTEPNAQIAMAIFTYDSSATLCEFCLNPAVGISQRIYEAYVLGGKK
ncbi:MAG TPA: penicillin-binding protein 2 [Candidatus Acidoferrales bacterium]|nr:penicillin-binding protein 2 [Candidatus Acidoferrales bacterium]